MRSTIPHLSHLLRNHIPSTTTRHIYKQPSLRNSYRQQLHQSTNHTIKPPKRPTRPTNHKHHQPSQTHPVQTSKTPPTKQPTHLKHLLLSTLSILLAAHILKRYMMRTTGPSMLPTIPASDSFVLVNRMAKYGKGVAVGDVICAKHPFLKEEGIVKRVIGIGGDYVSVSIPVDEREGGTRQQEEDIYDSTLSHSKKMSLRVPDGHVFLEGDNLSASLDSRLYGPIPMGLIVGKVVGLIYWEGWFWKFEWVRNGLVSEEGMEGG